MKNSASIAALLLIAILSGIVFLPVRLAQAAVTVHFYCESISLGPQGSIVFAGTTYTSGQSGSYAPLNNYPIVGNPPSPTPDIWSFGWWVVASNGPTSWVDNAYSSSTTFHLNGEAYVTAEFYTPIHANNPTSPITWGTRQRITGTAGQCDNGEALTVAYYLQGSGMGPPRQDGQPPFGGSGYYWTSVTVNSGSWDTGLIYPTLPISLGHQLPKTYDVYAAWGSGSMNERDSNVVSFTLNPASAQIAAPTLSPSAITLGQPVAITDQIFTSAFVNSNDLTGTLTVQAKKQGTSSWIDVIPPQSFVSTYGYSTVYGQYGDFYDLSTSWTPTETGTYDLRVIYSGNNYYYPISNPPSSTLVVSQQSDFGVSISPSYESIEGAGSVDYTVTVTSINGFNSEVTLTASANPTSDLSLSFVPATITPPPDGVAQSTLQATTSSETQMNGYTISITASGGGKIHTTQATLAVIPHSTYSIVFVPLNWQGDLSTFNAEADRQGQFVIDNVGILTWANTEILKVGQNLQLSFNKNSPNFFNGWADIENFAVNHGFTGDRYVGLTNEDIWGTTAGLSNWGHVVVVEQGAAHVTAHELGHSWGLLDEYKGDIWLSQAILMYGFPVGTPPNSYPGDDGPPVPAGWSYGEAFDGKRCIMGTADTTYAETGDPITRAFCPPHTKDEGIWGIRNYEGCDVHIDNVISAERSAVSGGLLRSVITFYRNGTTPTVHEVQGIGIMGKPDFCGLSQNFSIQVYSPTGAVLYNSNVTVSFLVSPSQIMGGDAVPFEVDSVTVTWLAGACYEPVVNVTLKDNLSNQTLVTQNVTMPEILPDISVTNLIPHSTVVGEGRNVEIDVDVQNTGRTTEIFNVTLNANGTAIDSQIVTVRGANFSTVSFVWNTTGFAKGRYALLAVADVVPGETNTTNNSFLGWVMVSIPGDVDGNHAVNIFDIVRMAGGYGTLPPNPKYNINCDIDGDGDIDIFDLVIAAGNYGESW